MNILCKKNIPHTIEGDNIIIFGKKFRKNTLYKWESMYHNMEFDIDEWKFIFLNRIPYNDLVKYGVKYLIKYNLTQSLKIRYHENLLKYDILSKWEYKDFWTLYYNNTFKKLTRETINKYDNKRDIFVKKIHYSESLISSNNTKNIKFTSSSNRGYSFIEIEGIKYEILNSYSKFIRDKLLKEYNTEDIRWVVSNSLFSVKKQKYISYIIKKRIPSKYWDIITLIKNKNSKINIEIIGEDLLKLSLNNKSITGNKWFIRNRIKKHYLDLFKPKNSLRQSYFEKEIINYVKNIYEGEIKICDRTINGVSEIDIFFPDIRLGIECNGNYWHSDIYKSKDYHQNKTVNCIKNNITLIHIWEDQWINNQDIIKSILLNKINKNKESIYARKCSIKLINDVSLIKKLYNNNHINGYTSSKHTYGLYYNNEIVQMISLSNNRKFLNNNEWELVRMVTIDNKNVIGGFSKLLKHAFKSLNIIKLNSYIDLDYFNGDSYIKVGFEKIKITKPGYFYVDKYGKRYHRYNFTKHKLIKEGFDPNKTEFEIMDERKYIRNWNSGNLFVSLGCDKIIKNIK